MFPYQGNVHLDRQKAVALLREILEVSKHSDIRAITLNQENAGNFSLKIDCDLNDGIRKCIQPILDRDKLIMKEEKDFFIIHSIDR